MLKHTHIILQGGYKRNLLVQEGWCKCLALNEKGDIL